MASFLNAEYVTPVIITDSKRRVGGLSLNQRFRGMESAAQYWEIDLSLEPDTGDNNLGGRLASHQAQFGTLRPFEITMPQHNGVGGNPDTNRLSSAGNSTVFRFSGNSVGDSIISASLGSGSDPVPIKAGQFVRFTGHSKIYMVTQDVTIIEGTSRSINIYPALISSLSSSRLINFNPLIRVRYTGTSLDGLQYRRGIVTQVRLRFREAL